jgi:alkaline phosphatase D
MRRRQFLTDLARYAAMCAVIPNDWRLTTRPRWADDPFQLGVASGDPTQNAVMIWTRLAPRPLEPDFGMTTGNRVSITWEVAEDDNFHAIVRQGRAAAVPELGHSVHVDVTELAPDRWYFYRFRTADATSPVGRLRTTPEPGSTTPLRFAFNSCQHWETGFYTAHHHLSREEIDLCAHLGDYIYEYGVMQRVRSHNSVEIQTLHDYRVRYSLYKSDPLLQQAHARCPWIVTWDDHEVDNNYAGAIGENRMESDEQVRARRAAAYQAWWENQPVRVPRAQSWADLNIVRSFDWGALARFSVIDSRQYRSDQVCGDITSAKVPCDQWNDPSRTLLGATQERWLQQGMASSRARWEVIANQTMLAELDSMEGSDRGLAMDSWSGYPAARERMLRTIAQHAPNRTVVITGDNHANWVNEIRASGTRGAQVAAEFLGTSISSGGDGSDRATYLPESTWSENPHVKWHNSRRGYVVCEVGPDTWRTEFKTVPYVTRPDAPIETASSWRLTRGRAGIDRE